MILYNITVIIDEDINDEWLRWIETHYIPDVMSAGMFISSRLLKVIDSPNDGITYCMQFIVESMDSYIQYKNQFFSRIQSGHDKKFAEKFVTFTTLMEFIETR